MTDPAPRERSYRWDDPSITADAAPVSTGLDLLRRICAGELPSPPIGHTLGFFLTEVGPGRVVFTGEPAEWLYNPIGSVHGGYYATLLDSAAACAVHTMLPAGTGYTSLDLSVRFLRPITVDTGTLTCVGTVLNLGRRSGLAEARLTDGRDRLLAHATSTCMLLQAAPPAG